MLLQIQDGTLSIGGQTVLSHFHFEIRGNEKIAVIGRNGCGKTTLLRLLAGELALDRDDKSISPEIYTSRKTTTGFLSQQAFSDRSVTVEKELLKCCPCPDKWDRERFAWEQEYDRVFTGFGFTKEDKKKRLEQFSGGEQTKIAMIRLLLLKPDLLLLDEPTNHLDVETVEWLEDYLRSYPGAVVMVSHDRFFLDRTADTVWEHPLKRNGILRGFVSFVLSFGVGDCCFNLPLVCSCEPPCRRQCVVPPCPVFPAARGQNRSCLFRRGGASGG